ncbi:MAG TPA: hypothetical protein VLC55_00170 [Burkholderiales bacterium]|nr:hypothetical protein [Burkholderiales bacterium]
MAVVIEELQAEVAPTPPPSREASPSQADAVDERKLLESLAREAWGNRRLAAD